MDIINTKKEVLHGLNYSTRANTETKYVDCLKTAKDF